MTAMMLAVLMLFLWAHDVGPNIDKIADSLERIADALEDNEVDEEPDGPGDVAE